MKNLTTETKSVAIVIIILASILILSLLILFNTDRFYYTVEVTYFNGDKEIIKNLEYVETFQNGCLNGHYCGVRNYKIISKIKR